MTWRLGRVGTLVLVLAIAAAMFGLGIAFTRGGPGQSTTQAAGRATGPQIDATSTVGDLEDATAMLQQRLRRVPGDHPGWASLGRA